jgi:hypothetical protein
MTMTNQTLILTNPVDDQHVHRLVAEFERLGHGFAIFDPGDFPQKVQFQAALDTNRRQSCLRLSDGTQIVLEECTSIWYRRPTRMLPRDDLPHLEQTFIQREAHAGIWGWLRGLPAFWVNHPDAVRAAGQKPEQLQRAAALGLTIPRSLVTNEPEALRSFYQACHGRVIYKLMGYPWYTDQDGLPLSAYTSLVAPQMLEEAHRVKATAHFFQEFVVKTCDIRVTIIGEAIFATAITPLSDQARVDFRADYAHLSYAPHPLPDEIRAKLLALTRSYHLAYAGIDLLLTKDDRYIYLELNALGQFGWLESCTGVPLYRTLATLLIEGERSS